MSGSTNTDLIWTKVEQCETLFKEIKGLLGKGKEEIPFIPIPPSFERIYQYRGDDKDSDHDDDDEKEWEEMVPVVSDSDPLSEYSSEYSEEHRTKMVPETSKIQRRKRKAMFSVPSDEDDDENGEDVIGPDEDEKNPQTMRLQQAIKALQKRGWTAFVGTRAGAEIWQHIRDVISVQSTKDMTDRFENLIRAGLPRSIESKIMPKSSTKCYLCDLSKKCKFTIDSNRVGRNCAQFYDAIRELIQYLKEVECSQVDPQRVVRLQAKVQINHKK